MAGLIIIDNSLIKNLKDEEKDLSDCEVCSYPKTEKEETDLQILFTIFQEQKNEQEINEVFNEKICSYHKNKFNSLKIVMNKDNDLFMFQPKVSGHKDIKGEIIAISEEDYNKPAEEEEGEEEDEDYQLMREKAD